MISALTKRVALHAVEHLLRRLRGGEAPKDSTKPRQTIQTPKRLYRAPEDYTKPRQIIQSSADYTKPPKDYTKPPKDYTKTYDIRQNLQSIERNLQNIRQRLKVFNESSNKYHFSIYF